MVQTDEKEKEEEPDTGMIKRPDLWSGWFGTWLCVFGVWGFRWFVAVDLRSMSIRG